jgi:hypothetical protein
MSTWNDFASRATGKDWDVKVGEAFWSNKETPIKAKVQIRVPTHSLEPTKERINLAQAGEDVDFQVYFISDKPVMFLDAQKFALAWVELWGENKRIEIFDGPPPDFEPPGQLEFTPELRKNFHKYKISKTSLAPLWGQPAIYCDEYDFELNAGPRQNSDPKVKYQQQWVETSLSCPFCLHTDWVLTYAMRLGKAEELWYDPQGFYYLLPCPKCQRIVDIIPRKVVNEYVPRI